MYSVTHKSDKICYQCLYSYSVGVAIENGCPNAEDIEWVSNQAQLLQGMVAAWVGACDCCIHPESA